MGGRDKRRRWRNDKERERQVGRKRDEEGAIGRRRKRSERKEVRKREIG